MKILAFAYACEPGKGSEPGAGWMLVRNLATFGEVCVITRANNREAIEARSADDDDLAGVRFVYVDLPAWARSWKKGMRGMRLYYVLWQLAALRAARRLEASERFDCVWHLTIANVWLGSAAALAGPPFLYGPVGGGVRAPLGLVPSLGLRGAVYEALREVARQGSRYLNQLARVSWRNASVILVQNEETRRWLPTRHRRKAVVYQNAAVEGVDLESAVGGPGRTAVFAARLIAWKGGALAIRAIARSPQWRLIVCGTGPDEDRLKRLAEKLRVGDRVDFRGRVPQEQLLSLYATEADVFLFPSIHDDSPLAVAEAVAAGLPVVCLDVGGPHLIAGDAGTVVSSRGRASKVVKALASALEEAAAGGPPDAATRRRVMMHDRKEGLLDIVTKALPR
ncbi:MAG TPA: glycosyltransferase [Actinomycetota bacterium]|nr:glycosyltransferase [Actinomycetota bacterium]